VSVPIHGRDALARGRRLHHDAGGRRCPLDSVVLLPHIAGSTHETLEAMEDLVLDDLRSFFREGRLVTPVA
jgi:lactate dehydrogenase-like 2-hydroxyacid dehydrogenase